MPGRGKVRMMVPGTPNVMVSVPDPAPHSPTLAPDAVSVFAAVMASRRLQAPSSASVSASELTVIAAAIAGLAANEARSPRAIMMSAPGRSVTAGRMEATSVLGGSPEVMPADAPEMTAIVIPAVLTGQWPRNSPARAVRSAPNHVLTRGLR